MLLLALGDSVFERAKADCRFREQVQAAQTVHLRRARGIQGCMKLAAAHAECLFSRFVRAGLSRWPMPVVIKDSQRF